MIKDEKNINKQYGVFLDKREVIEGTEEELEEKNADFICPSSITAYRRLFVRLSEEELVSELGVFVESKAYEHVLKHDSHEQGEFIQHHLYEKLIEKKMNKLGVCSGTVKIEFNDTWYAKEELGYDENFYMKDTREMYLNKGFTETEHNVFYADNVKDAYEFAYPFIRMMYSYDDVYGIWGAVKSCIINIGDFKLDLYEDMKYYYNQYTDGIYTYCANKWDPPVIVRRKLNDYRFANEIEEYYKGNGKWEKFSIYNSRIINIYEDELVAIENKYELEEAIKCYDKR